MRRQDTVRPYLDLEARVEHQDETSDDESEDGAGFINDNENEDMDGVLNYNLINATPESKGGDHLPWGLENILEKYTQNDAGPSSRTLDDLDFGAEDVGEVWVVKCRKNREQDVIQFIDNAPLNFHSFIMARCNPYIGCGYVYVRSTDFGNISKLLSGCFSVVRKRSGLNGIDMTRVLDPVEVALCGRQTLASAIQDPLHDVPITGPSVGTWVRLGRAEAKRKRRKVNTVNVVAESDERESGRSHSVQPDIREVTPLYTSDPAFVVKREGDELVVAFLARLPQSSIDKYSDNGQRYLQTLVTPEFNPVPDSDTPTVFGTSRTGFYITDGLIFKTVHVNDVRPLGKYPNSAEGRLFLASHNKNVLSNFPHIDDWRFDVGDMVVSVITGEEGVVCEQTTNGPIVEQRTEAGLSGHHSLGWAIKKRWFIGDYVRHISGVSGVVVAVKDQSDEVIIQDMSDDLDYDFVGHPNCFRATQRDQNVVGYDMARRDTSQIPSWVEAAKLGPMAIRSDRDFFRFRRDWTEKLSLNHIPQKVFLLSHAEATRKVKEMRTGMIPWKHREVLVSGPGALKGKLAQVLDVMVAQNTTSGLKLLIESVVQGSHGGPYLVDYNDVVDIFWELPLHLIDRPLNPIFIPPLHYVHPMTFHRKILPPAQVLFSSARRNLPGDDEAEGALNGDGVNSEPVFNCVAAQRHASQTWLYEAKEIENLQFKAELTGSIGTKGFNKRKSTVRMTYPEKMPVAVVEYYKREREIPLNVEVNPVHPSTSTNEPVFIFNGPFSNVVAVRVTAVKDDNNLHRLVGFAVDLKTLELDFESRVNFLPSEACVLAVNDETTRKIRGKIREWKDTQDPILQHRKRRK
ncbi:hypothetical protein E1B28_000007 [Marasmius oreades]|uniref:Uncharacterized protein n=1 Tax=Marasmius oreades TaxID=181124 RepID=A0A9P7V0E2_9AGAR|nr:uncharacterized protein E1B28_000007 [Marasmius oreades]KAG7098031.1 hypothetical protein E1B28_000007 [Marasmius oreades]